MRFPDIDISPFNMTSQEFDKILQRYLNDTCTAQEKRLVEEWFAAMGRSQEELELPEDAAIIKERLWSQLEEPVEERAGRSRLYWRLGKVAAALLFLAVSAFLLARYFPSANHDNNSLPVTAGMVYLTNPGKEEKKIDLKDGSAIVLKPGGEVSFPETFGATREVYLSGEAFFQVARDVNRPFLVHANEVTTKVLGTSFIIKAYHGEKEVVVAVKTGKVSVYAHASQRKEVQPAVILTPNQEIVYNRDENFMTRKLVDAPQIIAKEQLLKSMYTNAPVTQILEALEKSYGINIQYDEQVLSHCTLTSDLTEEGLYEQVAIICNALGAQYSIADMSIVIDAKGCQ